MPKETNISNKRSIVKNVNWQEADQLAIYNAWSRISLPRNKSRWW